ncbi:hypothetical protein A5756_01305 [Mycobacterium sp. 852002-53434_SCH5985345]|nr:hypothetical protein A5756_01305 [Mycobacterium sp. 852002-53434_SCH5985345]
MGRRSAGMLPDLCPTETVMKFWPGDNGALAWGRAGFVAAALRRQQYDLPRAEPASTLGE